MSETEATEDQAQKSEGVAADPSPESTPAEPQPAAADAAAADAAAESGEAGAEEPTLEQRLASAEEATERVRQQLLRVAADFDNYRKRAGRDVDLARSRGRQSTVKDLLPVFDNLERAGAHLESATDVATISDGIRMVLRQYGDVLTRMGIARVDPLGEVFDPVEHESIQHLESAEHEAGRVMAVVQPGYKMGSDLMRPALVVVSKGPPVVVDEPPTELAAEDPPASGQADQA